MQFDITILGGGLVGLSAGLAFSRLGLKVALIEKHAVSIETQTQDWRSLALSLTSVHFLSHMGIWQKLKKAAQPISMIDVIEKGKFGVVRLDAAKEGLPALGYVVPFALLKSELSQAIHASTITVFEKNTLKAASLENDHWQLQLSAHTSPIQSKLLLAAEGTESVLSQSLGIEFETETYGEEAVVARLQVAHAPIGVALERFAETGPLALLPADKNILTLVWALPKFQVLPLMEMSEQDFLTQVQNEVGFRMGSFKKLLARQTFPLHFHQAKSPVGPRLVLLGNSALSLHPVAGQSFNLALRNVARLHEVIANAVTQKEDFANEATLSAYLAAQKTDVTRTEFFANGLIQLFGNNHLKARMTRRLGFLALTLVPSAKHYVGKFGSGRLTSLAPLSTPPFEGKL